VGGQKRDVQRPGAAQPPDGGLAPAQTGLDDLLLDLSQVGVDGPAVGPGLGGRGDQQPVVLAEHRAHAQPEPDQVAGRAALGQGVVLGQH
jgi:hypothetical protein